MKVLTVLSGGEPVDYEETEAGIYVNATTPTIRYTAKISNMVSWSGAFTDIFVCELAQEIVTATTHNLDTVQLLEQKTQLMIRDAVKVGAIRAEVKIPLSQEIYNRAIGLARGQRTVGTTGNVSGEQGLDITGDINFREREAVAVCKRSLTELRDKLLKSYAWEFAKKTATLSASTKKAGWSNSYAMPSDCLRVLCVLNGDEPVEYEVSDGLILCNASGTITARYIKTITDLSQFDAVFKNVLCYELAQEVSSALTWNAEQITLLEQKKQLIIQDAYKSGIIREEIHIPLKDELIKRAITLSEGARTISPVSDNAVAQGVDNFGIKNERYLKCITIAKASCKHLHA